MSRSAVAVLLLLSVGRLARAQQVDTTLGLEGFLQEDDQTAAWTLVVPVSVAAFHIRTFTFSLAGPAESWRDLRNLYVAVTGRVSRLGDPGAPHLSLLVQDVHEATPPGTVTQTFDRGIGMRSQGTLAVIPDRFHWTDARGHSTGVNPLVLYTLLHERIGAVEVIRPTDLNFCLRVTNADGVVTWDTTFVLARTDARRFETQAAAFREGVQLPLGAARLPGHYTVDAGVCEAPTFNMTAGFDVQ